MSLKQRNGSHGSTSSEQDLAATLSNLSTTPTFSNLNRVARLQSPRVDDVPSPPVEETTYYSRPISLSTFSFSKMPPPMPLGQTNTIVTNATVDGNIPIPQHYAPYNPQPYSRIVPNKAADGIANRWTGNMFGRSQSNTATAGIPNPLQSNRDVTIGNNTQTPRGGRGMSRPPISPGTITQQQTPRILRGRGLVSSSPRSIRIEEYDSIDNSTTNDTASIHSLLPEVPLSTGLVTLSIHEALTFDGVELALHPDVFIHAKDANEETKSPGNETQQPQQTQQKRRIRPGDLVEIRVWSVRPGVKVSKPTPASNTAALKSNTMAGMGVGGSNYHSRNPSLVTLSSMSILSPGVQGANAWGVYSGNTSVMSTPVCTPGENVSSMISMAPPLPSIIGGGGPSPVARGGGTFQYKDENERSTPELKGEYLVDPKNIPGTIAASNISTVNSTLVAGGALGMQIPDNFVPSIPLISQNNKLSFSTIETDSVQGHSRDSSLITNSTAIHSRENSLLSPSPSWLTGNDKSPSKDESTAPYSVSKVPLSAHPLATISSSSKNVFSTPLSTTPPSASLSTARKQRPPLAPSHDVNVSMSSDSGAGDITKQLAMDLIAEVESPDRLRADTTGSEDALHIRNNSLVHSSLATPGSEDTHKQNNSLIPPSVASNLALPSTLPKLSEHDDGLVTQTNPDEENDTTMDAIQKTHFVRVSFVMPVSERSLSCIKSGARTQVSLLRRVADLYKVTAFCPVTVTQVVKREEADVRKANAADFITVTMKDQFVSRRDMYSFQKSFLNDWVYEGKRLSFDGIRTNAKVIRHGNHAIKSGIITEDTKMTFRSRSARIIWLVQLSSEMWDFASPYETSQKQEPTCHIYFDKFVSFCRRLFAKWKKLDLTHNLTVIYFSRTYLRQTELVNKKPANSPVHVDADGRSYEDHYKIVIENETRSDWESLIPIMKREFANYPKGVKWGNERIPSTASQGNVLEAVNITLNLLHLHYVDRDLHRTGNSLVVITSGNGVFEIDKNLASITKQRMMDNGIGSDMLSLGLPPLHIAPFFLYKEKGASSAEELQGFDDWKVYFEIPHWMNLSFVAYDDDEEPMLYKTNKDDTSIAKKESDTSRTWRTSNGFLVRASDPAAYSNALVDPEYKTANRSHYKHLISYRDFDDILQACRPRSRGDHGSDLPVALATLIKKINAESNVVEKAPKKKGAIDLVTHQPVQLNEARQLSPQRMMKHTSKSRSLEWGVVTFDDTGSRSSASSFSSGGHKLGSGMSGLIHMQSSLSLDDCLSPNGKDDLPLNIAAIKRFMSEHDKNVFSQVPTKLDRTSPSLGSINKGGIEAALEQYTPREDNETGNVEGPPEMVRDVGIKENSIIIPDDAYKCLAVSPLAMPYSFDRRSDGLRPSVMRLVAPEALSSFRNTLGSRRKSFSVLHDSLRTAGSNSIHLKTPKHHTTKHSSVQHSTSKKQPSRAERSHSHHHVSHQRRRKHRWVLNPFRQDDEDEVLAKRTHNRRRWSHVFPLGEEEFKRHAGPNWKSLCQPAILPMTIDFHPSPQELQDKERFRIKQYSVTLPPMNETNYASHRELLDELVAQRIIQDFQIVPRAIISSRRDATDNILEHTLSMGHKIQNLSYNPSQDSVDVIQYYANFAENETPQIYRYSLYSTLMQDYVSVAQTFTKYTSPYKWNEVDMLISGDAITHIVEGMRNPRISFVIIPDQFSDINQEKDYASKFQRLIEYFIKLQQKDDPNKTKIEIHLTTNSNPKSSSEDRRFVVDLRRRNDEKYEWMEIVHDSHCDTRRTFRITIQWLVAVAAKIDQQAQLLQRRCTQYGLKLVTVPHYSALRSCFMNPFVVPLTIPIRNKEVVDMVELSLTDKFGFVYDGSHMSDPNELDDLDGFDFAINKWSIKKRKKFVPACQYLHRSGTLFARILRDSKGCAIMITYLNTRHVAGDDELRNEARKIFRDVEAFILDAIENKNVN